MKKNVERKGMKVILFTVVITAVTMLTAAPVYAETLSEFLERQEKEMEMPGCHNLEDISDYEGEEDGFFDETNTLELVKGRKINLPKKLKLTKRLSGWVSADESVCKVSKSGTVRATGHGVTVISAKKGEATFELRVVVNAPEQIVKEIEIPVGTTVPVSVKGLVYSTSFEMLEWNSKSDNVSIDSIKCGGEDSELIESEAGDLSFKTDTYMTKTADAEAIGAINYSNAILITGKSCGTAKVTASYAGKKYSIKVNVTESNGHVHDFKEVRICDETFEANGRPVPGCTMHVCSCGASYAEYNETPFVISFYDEELNMLDSIQAYWGAELDEMVPEEIEDDFYFEGWMELDEDPTEPVGWDEDDLLDSLGECTGNANFMACGISEDDWSEDDEYGDEDAVRVVFLDFDGEEVACHYTCTGWLTYYPEWLFDDFEDRSKCGFVNEDGCFITLDEIYERKFMYDQELRACVLDQGPSDFFPADAETIEIVFYDFDDEEMCTIYTTTGYIGSAPNEIFEGHDLSLCGWINDDDEFIPASELCKVVFDCDTDLTAVILEDGAANPED